MGRAMLTCMFSVLALARVAAADGFDFFSPMTGRDVVKPMKPDWCGDATMEDWATSDLDQGLHRVERSISVSSGERMPRISWSDHGLHEMAQLACGHPNDAKVQKQVAVWRQGYIDQTGISEKEDREFLKLRVSTDDFDAQKKTFCKSMEPGDEASERDKVRAEALGVGTGCVDPERLRQDRDELVWWLDEHADPGSEILRAVAVTRCLDVLDRDDPSEGDPRYPLPKVAKIEGAFALCGADARRLDRAKLDKELADPKFNAFARGNALETFARAKAVADWLADAYKIMAAKDAGWKRILFDEPDKAWNAWEAAYTANKGAFEAARAFELKYYGPSKKALAGCSKDLRKNFAAYIKAAKPKTAADAKRAALDDIGYVLFEALALCDAVEQRYGIAEAELDLLNGQGNGIPDTRRGPRFAVAYAIAGALHDVVADRSKFPLQPRELYFRVTQPKDNLRQAGFDLYANKTQQPAHPPLGQLATVKKTGDKVDVTFNSVTTRVPNTICKPNGRIMRIDEAGQFVPDVDCHTEGTVAVTEKEKPLWVPAEFGGGLKVGYTALFWVNQRNEPKVVRDGLPLEVYSDKAMKKLVVWFGVSL